MTNSEIANDVQAGTREWSKEYDHYIQNPPQPGDILKASGTDAKVHLVVDLAENSAPFIYGRAFVPEIVGHPLGWYLQDKTDSQNFHGWKCILLPRARTELIRRFGLQNETMEVKSLRVVRPSKSGKALLCEVHDFGIEESKVEEPEVGVSAIETSSELAPSLETLEEEVDGPMSPETEKLVDEVATAAAAVRAADKDVGEEPVTEDQSKVEAQKPELTLGK